MTISLIITVYNKLNLLEKCLQFVREQSVLPMEIILSDDGSEEDIQPLLNKARSWFNCPVRYTRQEHQGFRAARVRNNGAFLGSGDLLVFLDQDIMIPRDYLRTAVKSYRKGRFLSGYPVRLSPEQTEIFLSRNDTGSAAWELVTNAQHSKIIRQWAKDLWYYSLNRLAKPLSRGVKLRSCVCAVSREDYVQVNGFDENFVGWGNEDDDLGKRLQRYGIKGYNFVLHYYPLHLYHEPHHLPGERPNQGYVQAKRLHGETADYRCENGFSSPRPDLKIDKGI